MSLISWRYSVVLLLSGLTFAQAHLFEEGRRSFGQGRYEVAIEKLELFLKQTRSPLHVQDARLLTGTSYLRLQKSSQALTYLKQYVEKEGFTQEGLRARVVLGQAYIQNNKTHEALSTSLEILNHKNIGSDLLAKGTLLKAESLMFLKKDQQAKQALGFLNKKNLDLDEFTAADLLLQKQTLELELKLNHCSELPAPEPLEEAVAKDQFSRSLICLKESLVLFSELVGSEANPQWRERAVQSFLKGLDKLTHRIQNPPSSKDKLTQKERNQYDSELKALFEADAKKALSQMEELIESWKLKSTEGKLARLQIILVEVRKLNGNLNTQ